MRKALLLIGVIVFAKVSLACLNESHKDKYGEVHIRDEHFMVYNEPDKKEATEFLNKYDLTKLEQYDKDVQSDVAVNLSYLGRYNEALEILKRLQKKYPEDYNITANLGTTYELTGNNELALQFIKKGILLNQDSHEGSEWVHVKILEAKLEKAKNPNWLQSNRVLNTGVSFNSKNSDALAGKIWDIEYQLRERVSFTPFPDKILANVFDELGDLYATQQSAEMAFVAYDFSLQYGPEDNYGVTKKMEELKSILKKQKTKIPSWKQYYHNRKFDKLQSEVTEQVITAITNPDSLKKETRGIIGLINTFTGDANKARRERERKRKLLMFLSGLGTIIVVGGGYVLFKKKNKNTHAT